MNARCEVGLASRDEYFNNTQELTSYYFTSKSHEMGEKEGEWVYLCSYIYSRYQEYIHLSVLTNLFSWSRVLIIANSIL